MEQIVYGDVLFAVNFSMDFLSLYLCAKIFHRKARAVFLMLAAGLGAAYSVAAVFMPFAGMAGFILDLAVSALMCFTAFPQPRGVRFSPGGFAAVWAMFFGTELLLGGCMTGLYNLLNKSAVARSLSGGVSGVYSDIPVWLLGLLVGASVIITYAIGRFAGGRHKRRDAIVEISAGNIKISLTALVDSGNLLRDPFSGKPAVITTAERAGVIVPAAMRQAVAAGTTCMDAFAGVNPDTLRRLRLIPASGVGTGELLWGFIPDKTIVISGRDCREVDAVLVFDKPCGGEPNRTSYGGYEAIIPPELL